MIQKKIILTTDELERVIMDTYTDGFHYGQVFEEEHIKVKNWTSKGRDVVSYTRNKIKEMIK